MMIINQVVQGGGGSGPAHYIEKSVDANGKLVNGSSMIDLTGVTDLSAYVLYYAYYNNTNITGALDLSSIKTLSGNACLDYGFNGCTGITSVDLSSLETITGTYALDNAFSGCSGITNIDISLLTTANASSCMQSTFSGCSSITSLIFYSLTEIKAQSVFNKAFQRCYNLTYLAFPSLTPNSFGATYTNQLNLLLSNVTGCTVHFPSNIQSTIGSWTSVTSGFGGTSTTVLFDLPATNTLTGADTETYTRNPKYDTATALAWKVGAYGTTNFTPAYYTSGTTDPSVADTIYSDDACTTSVTTITAIA